MTPTILALTAILLAAEPPTSPSDIDTKPMRKPHPLAPSLPQLTDEEENKLDDTINRFIKADAGQAKTEDAKQAGATSTPSAPRRFRRSSAVLTAPPNSITAAQRS